MAVQIVFFQARCCTLYLVESSSLCFMFTFVGPLMQSLKQRTTRKASLQSKLSLRNFGIHISKNLKYVPCNVPLCKVSCFYHQKHNFSIILHKPAVLKRVEMNACVFSLQCFDKFTPTISMAYSSCATLVNLASLLI